tara:strand:+ start:310 stop:801 length:492 start_codon:yes stop_codon:yes gene_type:complete
MSSKLFRKSQKQKVEKNSVSNALRKATAKKPLPPASPPRIPTLAEFIADPVHSSQPISRLAPSHYHNQYDFVVNRQGCPVVDFVGKLEHYERDFYYVLQKIGSADLWEGFDKYRYYGHRGEVVPNSFGAEYRNKTEIVFTEEMKSNLKALYRVDFAHFGYLMP